MTVDKDEDPPREEIGGEEEDAAAPTGGFEAPGADRVGPAAPADGKKKPTVSAHADREESSTTARSLLDDSDQGGNDDDWVQTYLERGPTRIRREQHKIHRKMLAADHPAKLPLRNEEEVEQTMIAPDGASAAEWPSTDSQQPQDISGATAKQLTTKAATHGSGDKCDRMPAHEDDGIVATVAEVVDDIPVVAAHPFEDAAMEEEAESGSTLVEEDDANDDPSTTDTDADAVTKPGKFRRRAFIVMAVLLVVATTVAVTIPVVLRKPSGGRNDTQPVLTSGNPAPFLAFSSRDELRDAA